MKKRWLGLGLALLIGTSVAVSDLGTMQVSATRTSDTTGSSTTQTGGSTGNSGTGTGTQSSNTGTGNTGSAYSTANNARFTVDGEELVVTENLNPAKYPKDFTETQVECKGKKYKGLKFSKADIQMICLLNQKTGVAAYHIYQDSDQSVYPFIRIEGGNDYIIAMPPFMMEEAQVPSGYAQTELEFEKGKAQVYQAQDNADSYLIYAMNSEGNKNWYEYNAQDKTYQTYQTEEESQGEAVDQEETQTQEASPDTSVDQSQYEELEEKYDKEKSGYRIIIAVLVVIIAFLMILLFNGKLLKKRDDREEEEDEDFDDNDGDFYDDYEEEVKEVLRRDKAEKREAGRTKDRAEEDEELFEEENSRRLPRFLRPGRKEPEVDELLEEEFFDEEYEDIKEEPEPVVRKAVRKPKAVAEEASPVKQEEKYESDIEILDLNDL